MRRIEFWPDYGGVLLHEDGQPLRLEDLGVPEGLLAETRHWLSQYDDARLDPATRDQAWIAEGQTLFDRLRRHLRDDGIELFDWEGYWGQS